MSIIAPSLLGADLLHLSDEIRKVESLKLPWIHFDQMDGHFVPNISFGPAFVAAARKETKLFLDVHLMLSQPLRYLEAYAKAGADGITVHAEAENPVGCLQVIRSMGLKAGLAINPDTPIDVVLPCMGLVDMVLVMTVQPGFGGQKLRAECLDKVRALRPLLDAQGRGILIESDGGINAANARDVAAAGVDVLVMGTGLFRAEDPSAVIRQALGE